MSKQQLEELEKIFSIGMVGIYASYDNDFYNKIPADGGISIERKGGQPEMRLYVKPVVDFIRSDRQKSVDLAKSLALQFLNSAYEAVKNYNDHSPEFEFFRHTRHAASHGNKFSFKGTEPVRPAEWRSKRIARSLHGTSLIFDFITPGDVVLLIQDIKNKLP